MGYRVLAMLSILGEHPGAPEGSLVISVLLTRRSRLSEVEHLDQGQPVSGKSSCGPQSPCSEMKHADGVPHGCHRSQLSTCPLVCDPQEGGYFRTCVLLRGLFPQFKVL